MAEAKWSGVLSTTEPRNDIGILNVRQGNLNSETVEFQIIQNNKPYDLTGTKVYFCTNFGLSAVEKSAVVKDAINGIISFTFNNQSMQQAGRQMAYFQINRDEVMIDSTQDFEFRIQSSILSRNMEAGSYIERFENILRTLGANAAYALSLGLEKVNELLNRTMTQTEFDSWVATLLDGGPSIYMETLSALIAAYPNGAAGVALVRETNPAKIYVWKNSAWTFYGDYQGLELKDDAVTNFKIANNVITPDKITTKVTINLSELPIHSVGHYYNTAGVLIASTSFNVRSYRIPKESKGVVLNWHSKNVTPNGVLKNDDGTITPINDTPTFLNIHKGIILFNEFIGQQNGLRNLVSHFWEKGYETTSIFKPIDETAYINDGVSRNGLIEKINGYSHYKLVVDPNYIYSTMQNALPGYTGSWFNGSDIYLSTVTKNSAGQLVTPEDASYALLNLTATDEVFMKLKESVISTENKKFITTVNKPYIFKDSTVDWAGDSIFKGHITGSTITPNNLPKLFSERHGITTYSNIANAGALFTKGFNAVETILETIVRTGLSKKFLFIGAGTNDFGLGVPLVQFEQALVELCAYLKTNYNGQVIFVSPLNRVTPSNNQQATLEEYRTIIGKQAIANGFGFVNGGDFNFPSESGSYASIVFGDGLHLTELGNEIYSKSLSTLLC